MNEEQLKKIAKETFMENIMSNLDSSLIFTYIQNLEQENQQLNQQLKEEKNIRNKAIEYCQIINDSDYVYSQDEVTNKVLQILQNKE